MLKNIPGIKCLLDDVLITGQSEQEALDRLSMVLTVIENAGLKLKQNKCKFMVEEVEYLGILLGSDGIKTDPIKTRSVMDAKSPTNVKELRAFLGAVTYYNKFLKNLSQSTRCLNDLLKKNEKWVWNIERETCFQNIKSMLEKSPVLEHYDPTQELTVITDASPTGLGAVLAQGKYEKPIMYISRSLNDHEQKYCQIEREGLCVLFAFERLRQFLLGRPFKLVTDNKPLSSVYSKSLPALAVSRIQRWAIKLLEYDYTVEVRRSEQIPVADWLSRLPDHKMENKTTDTVDEFSKCFQVNMEKLSAITSLKIAQETARDALLSKVKYYIDNGWPTDVSQELRPYKEKQAEIPTEAGCILWGLRVVVPRKFHSRVLTELHSGHQGMVKMKQLARNHVWWFNIDKDIENEVCHCNGCIQKRVEPP